jgi:hypothetical protein
MLFLSQLAEDTAVQLLQDQATGLVPSSMALAANKGITLPDLNLIDESAGQLYRAWVDPNDFIDSNNAVFPAVFVYIAMTEDRHQTKFNDFSGALTLGIDILLSSRDPEIPETLQQYANIYTDALYTTFGIQALARLNGNGILMNGGLKVVRQRPVRGGENWIQLISAAAPLFIN